MCCCIDKVEKYQVLVNTLNLCEGEDWEQSRAGQELELHSDNPEESAGFLKRMSRDRKQIYASKHRRESSFQEWTCYIIR